MVVKNVIIHRGGQVIGEGSYGLVVQPAISCNFNSISKIFTGPNGQQNMELEAKLLDRIREIDPKEIFTINNYQKCRISEKHIVDLSDDLRKKLSKSNGKVLPQLILRFGGLSLTDLFKIKNNSIELSLTEIKNLFLNFMIGFEGLQEKNIVHNDIKSGNMLLAKNKKNLFLIDFGMAVNKASVFHHDNSDVLRYTYPTYPPEYQLAGYLLKMKSLDTVIRTLTSSKDQNLLKKLLTKNIRSNYYEYLIYKKNKKKYHHQIEQYIQRIIRQIESNYVNFKKMDLEDVIRIIFIEDWNKIDIYGLGAVLTDILFQKVLGEARKSVFFLKMFDLSLSMKSIDPAIRVDTRTIVNKLSGKKYNNGIYMGGRESIDLEIDVKKNIKNPIVDEKIRNKQVLLLLKSLRN